MTTRTSDKIEPVPVDVRGRARKLVPAALRKKLAAQVAQAVVLAGQHNAELTLSLVDDDEIRELNRDFADEDKATDVLSFSMREGEGGGLHPDVLGDVVISVETAQRQAAAGGRALDAELLHLAVHGLAHLCGYDHATPAEERVMFAWEAELRGQVADGEGMPGPGTRGGRSGRYSRS